MPQQDKAFNDTERAHHQRDTHLRRVVQRKMDVHRKGKARQEAKTKSASPRRIPHMEGLWASGQRREKAVAANREISSRFGSNKNAQRDGEGKAAKDEASTLGLDYWASEELGVKLA